MPQRASQTTILSGCLGLNTRIDPARIPVDGKTLQSSLAQAVNVDIDDFGRISRRKGYTASHNITGSCHSLFAFEDVCLYIEGTSMYRLHYDFETQDRDGPGRDGVRSGLKDGLKMYYIGIGREIYYSNGEQNGVYDLDSEISHVWAAQSYIGPDTVKVFQAPPPLKHLELYNGRIYGADNKTIWYTEPFAFSWVDKARNYLPFQSKVRMIRAVVDGIYVSTETQTIFLNGADAPEFQHVKCADYPAVENTDLTVEGAWIGEEMRVKAALWLGLTGVCAGMPGGQFLNLTHKKIVLPPGCHGASAFIDGKFISLLSP